MIKRVHCKYYNGYGHCKVLKKKLFGFLWKVKQRCIEYDGCHGDCPWAERSPKPPAPPRPAPSPQHKKKSKYKNYKDLYID